MYYDLLRGALSYYQVQEQESHTINGAICVPPTIGFPGNVSQTFNDFQFRLPQVIVLASLGSH